MGRALAQASLLDWRYRGARELFNVSMKLAAVIADFIIGVRQRQLSDRRHV
ncbi:hypothetical protein BSU04_05680 [Caballeronia sordidicola]|uniref:Uncharacterized protein n=1 Tax=Caballeronia sordidicola TaxID=196367 RepID=A0A226X8E3_CABSO|nr:hypothetical protein BSU04_05680 [Caballeronia sordidicola]